MRLLLIDDDRSYSEMLEERLKSVGPELCGAPVEVATASVLDDAIQAANSDDPPNLVILDLNLEGQSYGHATFKRFQEANARKVPVAILTGMSFRDADAVEVVRTCYFGQPRAQGFLLKRGGVREIFTGFARVLNGERFIPEEVIDFISNSPSQALEPTQAGSKHAPLFTERQRTVADLLKQGLRNKEIAKEINRSELYVRQIVTEIFRKVDVHTRTQFMVELLKRGAVNQSDYA